MEETKESAGDQCNVSDGVYTDPKFRAQLGQYLDITKNKQSMFPNFMPPPRLFCAYGLRNQGIADAAARIASSVGYSVWKLDIPKFLTEERIKEFRVGLDCMINDREPEDKHVCVVIDNYQRAERGAHSIGMPYDFAESMETLSRVYDLTFVLCINGHPGRVSELLVENLTIFCLFHSPDTEDRELLFRYYLEQLQLTAKKASEHAKHLTFTDDMEGLASMLADRSTHATVGHIKEFITIVWQQTMNVLCHATAEKPVEFGLAFVEEFLCTDPHGALSVNPGLTGVPEADLRKYAGETTFEEDAQSAKEKAEKFIFASPNRDTEAPTKRRKRMIEIEEE